MSLVIVRMFHYTYLIVCACGLHVDAFAHCVPSLFLRELLELVTSHIVLRTYPFNTYNSVSFNTYQEHFLCERVEVLFICLNSCSLLIHLFDLSQVWIDFFTKPAITVPMANNLFSNW